MLSTTPAFLVAVGFTAPLGSRVWSCDPFSQPASCFLTKPTRRRILTRRTSSRTAAARAAPPQHSDDGTIVSKITDNILPRMISFFALDMVDSETNRFFYLCRPQKGQREHRHMPIRDLAAAWDATKVMLFLETTFGKQHDGHSDCNASIRQRLRAAICSTLEAYQPLRPMAEIAREIEQAPSGFADQHRSALRLDASMLRETANIAHSALLVMASANAYRLSICSDSDTKGVIGGLLQGILSRQRPDGAFRVEFTSNGQKDCDDIYKGIDFYPGEAMLAMMDVYDLSEEYGDLVDEAVRESIVSSMERAYMFYCDYYQKESPYVNFNIWQIISLSRFYDVLGRRGRSDQAICVAQHVLHMCRGIVNSRAWKELKQGQRFYANLNTVEIVCGLDAIAEGIRLADAIGDDDTSALLKRNAMNAVYFVEWSQSQVSQDSPGFGGLGLGGAQVLEQRLDVSGHALSALVKLCIVL